MTMTEMKETLVTNSETTERIETANFSTKKFNILLDQPFCYAGTNLMGKLIARVGVLRQTQKVNN